ncbi:Retrovirus-related Pol polyprotein from type-2 retrotransposable element R2DM [Symbiodinium microadriaticum]|uniref:Retrovirus-related Pol polyprotein from type-2 retrotransposable element R2DM n=1 Tax=Symbiodinium microadriaticum TaxID=2951 RepID=A0A1Q9F1X3_SYMMI|nr:Retrovirus-related Pol polyprotein from type-2 retrotransposable element R2DM [Symbiodinium microadriaticum]
MTSNGISECLHLKAAARDIISEYFCRDSLESATAAQYADELLQAYWKEASAADVIRDARVSEASAKNGGIFPVQQVQQLSGIKKRSLQRAVKRALRHGHSVYRGKQLVAQPDLLQQQIATPSASTQLRLECITWNVGGLTQVLMAELMVWLRQQGHVRVLMLQETHWSASCDWAADGWYFCHSASSKPKSGGVLIGLRQDTFSKELIRWQEIVPGRLLHVRAFALQQHVDLITIYQHALPFNGELLEDVMKRRNSLLKLLDTHVGSLPARSSVVIGGDLNCVLEPSPPHVGHGVHRGADRPHLTEERQWIGAMLRRHGLCALNSWRQKRYTYRHPNGKSQIDYLIVRKVLADNQARNAAPATVPLAGWRTSGHLPVRASLKWDWRPWKHAQSRVRKPGITALIETPQQHQDLAWLKQCLAQGSTVQAPPQKPQVASIDSPVRSYWCARARFKATAAQTLKGIFERFRLYQQMNQAHKALRRAARERKVQQHQQILQMAEDAAAKGDTKGLYRCVRWLAPKTFKQGIRLRDSAGFLMSPAEECRALSRHAAKLFTGTAFACPEMLPLPVHMYSVESWTWALSQLTSHKAVPRHEPAVKTWKDNITMSASALARVSQQALCQSNPVLPHEWRVVQLAWLPKPNKTPTCPEHLRSIGLLSADRKGFLLILRWEITPFVRAALADVPQYAYRPQAGTLDALLRSSLHCTEVRDLLSQHQRDHTSKILDEPRISLVGGFMCSLDLAKAFDSVPHSELYCSMCEAGVPLHLANAVMQVHCRSVCVIDHGGQIQRIHMTRGLRQGCPIAPILHACWTVRLCRRLDSALGAGWSRRHLSIFADDTHGSWIIHNERELCDSVQHLRVLIETLESMGLQINYTKSHIVIQLRGQLVAKMQKKFFKMRHGVQCLRIQAARDIYLPCVDKLDYLGAVLSYTGFESQTVQIRAHKADSAFRQLRKPLRSRSALSTGHRVRLYRAIVLSSLVYGLVGVGVSAEVVKKVSSTVAGHMRKILRVYEHGISNVEVLRRAGIDPIAMLFAGARQLCRSIELDCFRSPGLKQRETSRIHFILEQLSAHAAQPEGMHIMYVRKAEVCEVACPECGIYFGTREGLSQHIKKKHPDIVHRSKLVFDRERHTLFGIPMCRFCHMRLHDWSSITKHIQDGHCSWVKEKIAEGHTSTELLQLIEVLVSFLRIGLFISSSTTQDFALFFDFAVLQPYANRSRPRYFTTERHLTPDITARAAPKPIRIGMTMDQISQEELNLFNTFMPSGAGAPGAPSAPSAGPAERDAKTAKLESRGKGATKEFGTSRGKRNWSDASWGSRWDASSRQSTWNPDETELEAVKAAIAQMQRLILRHEDAINLQRIETSYVAHMRISTSEAIVSGVYHAAAGWKQAKENNPESLNKPLRATLVTCVFLELRTRVANLTPDQANKLKELQWYEESTTTWHYVKWNAEQKKLVKDEEKEGISTVDVLKVLDDILRAAPKPNAVARFHPTRPLAQEMSGETVTFLMQFGNHNDHAEKLCTCMDRLCGLSVTQLVGLGVKPDRLRRSTLANQIASSFMG